MRKNFFTQDVYDNLVKHQQQHPHDVVVTRNKKDGIDNYWIVPREENSNEKTK